VNANVRSANARVRVLIHELAHGLGIRGRDLGRHAAEVLVETVAFIVAGAIGLDTSGESIPYVASWGENDLGALRDFAAKVDETARVIEKGLGVVA
jgi:hypothetical protein